MRIKYLGQIKDKNFNTRCAEISFDGDNEKETKLAEEIVCLIDTESPWSTDGGGMFSDCCIISMEDKEDFEEFKDWYKEAKKILKNT